ncbi:hypothetical protein AAIB41_11520 [Brucella sp. BE17]|uniref:hypothetical protein n=1 Tax=Brucella sp. BE17 TaxID=3142977 RepID=UPI0031BB4D81
MHRSPFEPVDDFKFIGVLGRERCADGLRVCAVDLQFEATVGRAVDRTKKVMEAKLTTCQFAVLQAQFYRLPIVGRPARC